LAENWFLAHNRGVVAKVDLGDGELYFAKRSDKWGLHWRLKEPSTWCPLLQAPRAVRIMAAHALPRLVEELEKVAAEELAQTADAVRAAHVFLESRGKLY
jgi:hypothetical protein